MCRWKTKVAAGGVGLLAPLLIVAEDEAQWIGDDEQWLDSVLGLEAPVTESGIGNKARGASGLEEGYIDIGSLWTADVSLFGSFGWKENILYSSGTPVDSSFSQIELEGFAMRPQMGEAVWELTSLFYGQLRNYSEAPDLNREHLAVLFAQAAHAFEGGTKASMALEATHSKQALDASLDEFEVAATTVQLWRPEVTAKVERRWERWGLGRMSVGQAQSRYDHEQENYDRNFADLEWGLPLGDRYDVSAKLTRYREDYAAREARLVNEVWGDAPLLEIEGDALELEWVGKPELQWLGKLRSELVWEWEDDAQGNYYERSVWQFRESADFRVGKVGVSLGITYRDISYDYRSSDEEGVTRADESLRFDAKASYPLRENWEAYLMYEWMDKESNVARFSYESSLLLFGIRWQKELGL